MLIWLGGRQARNHGDWQKSLQEVLHLKPAIHDFFSSIMELYDKSQKFHHGTNDFKWIHHGAKI